MSKALERRAKLREALILAAERSNAAKGLSGLKTRDLAREAGYRGLVTDCEKELRRIVDPEAADALAKADQRARIAAFGGREAIIARGSFGYSPTPGTKPVYN